MTNWHASLSLQYSLAGSQTIVHHKHEGPLRVLKSLYPEGDAVCHNVLVHPPSGLVGGDSLEINIEVASGAHALITTPGATRFYGSDKALATQQVNAHVTDGARLEWLPLEALAYNTSYAKNSAVFSLDPDAQLMAWDVTALGLPHANQPWIAGKFSQNLEIKNLWLESGLIDASDQRLIQSPVGLNGHLCLATLILAQGHAWSDTTRTLALEIASDLCPSPSDEIEVGVTSPNKQVIVLRSLSHQVEPVMQLLKQIWLEWRKQIWDLGTVTPRIWSM